MSQIKNLLSLDHNSSSRSQRQMETTFNFAQKSTINTQSQSQKMDVLILGKNSDPELEFIIQQSEMWINNDIDSNEDLLCFNDCVEIEIVTLSQTHFDYILKDLKRKSPEILSHSTNSPIILINSTRYIPSLIRLIATFILELGLPKEIFVRSLPYTFNQQNDYLLQLTQMTHSKLLQFFNFSETYTYVFFDIKLKNGILECKRKIKSLTNFRSNTPEVQKVNQFRIIIQLHSKIMPKTCFNFYQLCQGNFKNAKGQRLTYKNTSFHAIQKNAYIQGGAFSDHERDESIFGPTFEDESYAIKHDQPGIVCMANQGIPHTNASQFYITLASQPDKDHKYVAFGLVVFGMKYLRKLNKLTDKSSYSPAYEARIINCGEYNFQKDDFVSETKKDFDLLDNQDIVNTQLALAARQRQERSISTVSSIRPKMDTTQFHKIQIKKDKEQFASQKERFKSSFQKHNEQNRQKYPQISNNQGIMLNSTFQEYRTHTKKDERQLDLIKPSNKEIFKQYKKDLDEQPIFQFQNYNLLADRGGAGKNNKKIQEQKLQSHTNNQFGNSFLKMQVNNLGGLMSNFGSISKIPESNSNLDQINRRVPSNQSPNQLQQDAKRKSQGSLNGEQYLLKLLNLPNIALSPNKEQNGQNKLQGISPNLPKSKEPLRFENQQKNQSSNQNLSEKEDLFTESEFGSRQALTYLRKQTTPQGNPLLDYLSNNLVLGNGQALQFRRVPNIDRVTTNSYKNQRARINSNVSIQEQQTKNRLINMNSILSIQNALKTQNTYRRQPSQQNHMFDDVSQKIISNSKEELGSLIIISQISQFKKFIAFQYQKKLQEDQMSELNNIIPGISESIAMQLPISLKKSLSSTQEQIILNKQLTQEIQIPHTDTKNTLLFMSKQVGFDISEVDDDW